MSIRSFALSVSFATLASTVAFMGCSEPVPPAADGGAYIAFSTAGGVCSIGQPHNGQIGFVTVTDIRSLVKDTVGGANVFCRITGDSNGFEAQGSITLGATHVDFNVSGLSNANDINNPATGAVTYSSLETIKPYSSPGDTPCEFWIDPNTDQTIELGKLWMSFRCAKLADAGTASTCSVAEGSAIAMQNCEL